MERTTKQIIELATQYKLVDDNIDFQALDCTYDKDDVTEVDLDTLREEVEQYICESVDIIYYTKAIEFLAENDPSLRDSMDIAAEFCTPLDKINSEFLASILLQSMVRDEFSEFMDALEALDEAEAA